MPWREPALQGNWGSSKKKQRTLASVVLDNKQHHRWWIWTYRFFLYLILALSKKTLALVAYKWACAAQIAPPIIYHKSQSGSHWGLMTQIIPTWSQSGHRLVNIWCQSGHQVITKLSLCDPNCLLLVTKWPPSSHKEFSKLSTHVLMFEVWIIDMNQVEFLQLSLNRILGFTSVSVTKTYRLH